MEYSHLPGVKNPVSRLIFGAAGRALQENRDADALLDGALAAGINTFDTARVYGDSEICLGRWIQKRGVRDQINLITKGCHHNAWRRRVTPYDLRSDLMDSLARLDTGRVDIYLLHRDDASQPVGPLVETLNELWAAGRIGCFGGSNWSHTRLLEANEYADAHHLRGFTLSSPYFGLAEQLGDPWGGGVNLSGPQNTAARDWYRQTGMPVLAYSCLGQGFFSGRYSSSMGLAAIPDAFRTPDNLTRLARAEALAARKGAAVASIALAWALRHPVLVFPIVSASSLSHLAANLKALDVSLTREEFLFLNLGQE